MKLPLGDVRAAVTSWAGRLHRALDPPLAADAPPLEIRQAIIDAIEQRALPAGGGQRVLAHNAVSVTLLAPTPDDRLALQAVLADLQTAVATRLREIRCQVPAGFVIDLRYVRRARPGWAPDQRLAIEHSLREDVAASREDPRDEPPGLQIVVVRGAAAQATYTLSQTHVQIGRSPFAVDNAGRSRTNHIAFVEDGDEHSRSVGRAHASIRFQPERREYRLFDEGSRNGTRVVRNGIALEISRRDPIGVKLLSGDEVHLGTAAIRVLIESSG